MSFTQDDLFLPSERANAPREIAFLADYGAPVATLVHAGEVAAAVGVSAEMALLGEGLAQEEFFYRALADFAGAPYHTGAARLDPAVSPDRIVNIGFASVRDETYRAIVAPRGEALRLLVDMIHDGRRLEGLAITSPRRLGALVRVERGAEIAARAAHTLEQLDPALCAHGEMRPAQTVAAAAFGLGMIALAFAAPWVERAVSSLLLWVLFSATIFLRFAASIAADPSRPSAPVADADLPVYTVIVAMYREGEVIPKLVAGLNAFDYPVLGSKLT